MEGGEARTPVCLALPFSSFAIPTGAGLCSCTLNPVMFAVLSAPGQEGGEVFRFVDSTSYAA